MARRKFPAVPGDLVVVNRSTERASVAPRAGAAGLDEFSVARHGKERKRKSGEGVSVFCLFDGAGDEKDKVHIS